MLINVCKTQI